jgi:hypothetical protein
VLLLEQIPVVDVRLGSLLLNERVHSTVVGFPRAFSHEVVDRVARLRLHRGLVETTNHDVYDDLGRVLDYL